MSKNSILSNAIKENIAILDYAQQMGYTPERCGKQYTLKEHDSVRINTERNVYYRHSTETGGSIIDFVMEFGELTQDEAIRKLRGCLPPSNTVVGMQQRSPTPQPKPHRKVQLPKAHNGRFSRVFAYLTKSRGIDSEIVAAMVKRKALYEDERHNCVFVGYNEKNEAAYGCVRGTNTQTDKPYRGDCANSDKRVGWYIDNKATALIVTEAPIDAMSFMSMLKLHGKDYRTYNYLALGGVAANALERLFADGHNRQIERIYLATDNDDAGNAARGKLRKVLEACKYRGKIVDKIPLKKDWNDDLKDFCQPQNKTKNKIESKQQERGISYEHGA